MMRRTHWFLIVLASCSRIPGAPENAEAKPHASAASNVSKAAEHSTTPPLTGAGAAFQRSYDEEAAGRLDGAVEALDALPPPQNESYTAAFRRGWLLYRLGRHLESIAAYMKATSLEPESIEARVGALLPELAARRWRDAEITAREILQRDPANYYANLRLAFAVYNLGRHAEAEKLYRHLLTMYPSDTDVRAGLGWSLFKLGKRDEAKKYFSEVLDVSPHSALAADGLRATKGS
jgi:tetratricopeptide (TPR) repeat protein